MGKVVFGKLLVGLGWKLVDVAGIIRVRGM